MALLNGTPSNTDGTEITSGITLKNILNGYAVTNYSNSGTTYNTNRNLIIVPICLRMKSGYKATNVKITGVLNNNIVTGVVRKDGNIAGFVNYYPLSTTNTWDYIGADNYSYPINVDITSTKNVLILLMVRLHGTQTSIPENTTLLSISYQEDKV